MKNWTLSIPGLNFTKEVSAIYEVGNNIYLEWFFRADEANGSWDKVTISNGAKTFTITGITFYDRRYGPSREKDSTSTANAQFRYNTRSKRLHLIEESP